MSIYASIVICTRNREAELKQCIESFSVLNFQEISCEILIIDNASTDNTKSVVEKLSDQLNIRYVYEPITGLSKARNTGLEAAKGEITIFLDDDTIVYPEWLSEMLGPFADYGKDVGIVAGDVVPVWGLERPEWLKDRYLPFYSAGINWDTKPRFMNSNEWILECNVAVRTKLLRDIGGFNEKLGRAGDSLVSGENIVFDQMRIAGVRAYYNPNARVQHVIHEERLNKTWLLKRCLAQGISTAIISEFFPRGRNIVDAGIGLKVLHDLDFESLPDNELYSLTMFVDRLGYVLKKKKLL